jgi:ATP-dependent 26S proteasome regulatory subunit
VPSGAEVASRTVASVDRLWARILGEFGEQPGRPAIRVERDDRGLIAHAAEVFGLSPVEETIVALLLGVAWGRGARNRPLELRPVDVIAMLGGGASDEAEVAAAFAVDAPLSRWGLLAWRQDGPRLGRAVSLDDEVWPRFFGGPGSARWRARAVELGFADLALEDELASTCRDRANWLGLAGAWPTLMVVGAPGTGRGALARAGAHALGLPVIVADGATLDVAAAPALRRECVWHQAALILDDADRAPAEALAAVLDELAAPVFATGASAILERLLAPGRVVRTLEVPAMTSERRAAIWRRALGRSGLAVDAVDADGLATRFAFAPGRIATAVAALAGSGAPVDTESAGRLCRALPEVRVGGLANRLEARAGWRDLIVAPAVRRELELIVTWGRHRAQIFGPAGAGAHARAPRGLACLLHGPAGTGKTLAAQVIACELGLELYRVDLAAVVDKYIGETEKRLDLLFREAQAAGVMLFFDEADALFAQRTDVRDARDRYANLETGFLLQRLEDHAGITVLASNHQGNIDPAFHRRLSVIVELPLPGPGDRRAIWSRHLPPDAVAAADLDQLAAVAELSGGDIRNAVVFAVMYARGRDEPLAASHLMLGAWREMTRAGRLVDPAEFGRWKQAIIDYATVPRR